MKRLVPFLLLCFSCFGAEAASRTTITITVTNVPVTGNTLAINGSVRIWTNANSSSTILTNLTGVGPATTNLANNLASYPLIGPFSFVWAATNSFKLIGPLAGSVSATSTGNWATVVLTPQTGPDTFTALWPMENMPGDATNKTNQASSLVYGLSTYSTNAFATNSSAASNFITKGASPTQVVASPIFLWSVRGTNAGLIGGIYTAPTNVNPVTSNLVNYGNAIRSAGPGGNSFQAGSNAQALAGNTIAIGNNSLSTGTLAMAIGTGAIASNQSATAIGNSAQALTNNATAVGQGAVASGNGSFAGGLAHSIADSGIAIGTEDTLASGPNAIAIGPVSVATAHGAVAIGNTASATHSNAVVLGTSAASTSTNQVMAGSSAYTVIVPGLLSVTGTQTNTTFTGTNVLNGRLDLKPRSNAGLANGNNAAVVLGTNVYIKLSGATTIGVVCGFAAELDGSWHIVEISGAITNTIANQSGVDPTAANRIVTGTGADISFTNSPTIIQVIYNATDSRWKLMGLNR